MTAPARPRVVIIGRRGALASALAAIPAPELDVRVLAQPDIDFCSPGTLVGPLQTLRPDLIINTAAVTDPDQAERDRKRTLWVNAHGAGCLAGLAAQTGAALVHVSTGSVFDGKAARPYREEDMPGPTNILGATKLLGEELALQGNPRTLVLRTSWLFGAGRARALATHLQGQLPARATGSPTSAEDLARLCLWLTPRLVTAPADDPVWGITHAAGWGSCTLSEFSKAAGRAIPRQTLVQKPAAALNTALDCTRLTRVFGHRLPHWRESLRASTPSSLNPAPEAA